MRSARVMSIGDQFEAAEIVLHDVGARDDAAEILHQCLSLARQQEVDE